MLKDMYKKNKDVFIIKNMMVFDSELGINVDGVLMCEIIGIIFIALIGVYIFLILIKINIINLFL